jgi:hypothetical protein
MPRLSERPRGFKEAEPCSIGRDSRASTQRIYAVESMLDLRASLLQIGPFGSLHCFLMDRFPSHLLANENIVNSHLIAAPSPVF